MSYNINSTADDRRLYYVIQEIGTYIGGGGESILHNFNFNFNI